MVVSASVPADWLVDFVPSVILGLADMYGDFSIGWLVASILNKPFTIHIDTSKANLVEIQNLTDELASLGIIIGLLFIAFSREKVEDEMIGQLRLEALQWSVYANYLILALAILTLYNEAFFNVMVYNMFTVLLVFIGRFRWLIYRNNHRLAV